MTVKDIDKITKEIDGVVSFQSDSQDVNEFNERLGVNYDSYFTVWKDCDLIKVFGMEGIVPYLHKEIFKVKCEGDRDKEEDNNETSLLLGESYYE